MNKNQWKVFCDFRDEYKKFCLEWYKFNSELSLLQKEACKKDTPPYPLENPIVYNSSYDEVKESDRISLIVVGDNPGKEEQLNINKKYLVGQSGRIADGFFRRNPEFDIDFRKNVIITNKTPIHTAKTTHLKYLLKNGSDEIKKLLFVSQLKMAELTAKLHQGLNYYSESEQTSVSLWLVGYSELKNKGIFLDYKKELLKQYKNTNDSFLLDWEKVFVYQHFSMNRFLIDLKEYCKIRTNGSFESDIKRALLELGKKHKEEIFCQ